MISTLYRHESLSFGDLLEPSKGILLIPAWEPPAEPDPQRAQQWAERLIDAWWDATESESTWLVGPQFVAYEPERTIRYPVERLSQHFLTTRHVVTSVPDLRAMLLVTHALLGFVAPHAVAERDPGLHIQGSRDALERRLFWTPRRRAKLQIANGVSESLMLDPDAAGHAVNGRPLSDATRSRLDTLCGGWSHLLTARTRAPSLAAALRHRLERSDAEFTLFANRIHPDLCAALRNGTANDEQIQIAYWFSLEHQWLERTVVTCVTARNEDAALCWLDQNHAIARPAQEDIGIVRELRRVASPPEYLNVKALQLVQRAETLRRKRHATGLASRNLRLGDIDVPTPGHPAQGSEAERIARLWQRIDLRHLDVTFCEAKADANWNGQLPCLTSGWLTRIAVRIVAEAGGPIEWHWLKSAWHVARWGVFDELEHRDFVERLWVVAAVHAVLNVLQSDRRRAGAPSTVERMIAPELRALPDFDSLAHAPREPSEVLAEACAAVAARLPGHPEQLGDWLRQWDTVVAYPVVAATLLLLAQHRAVAGSERGLAQIHPFGPELLGRYAPALDVHASAILHVPAPRPTLRPMIATVVGALPDPRYTLANHVLQHNRIRIPANENWGIQRLYYRIAGAPRAEKGLELTERMRAWGYTVDTRMGVLEGLSHVTTELYSLSRYAGDWHEAWFALRTRNLAERIFSNWFSIWGHIA